MATTRFFIPFAHDSMHGYQDGRRSRYREILFKPCSPVYSSRGQHYDFLVGLQVSYLGPDNFGDVFSVANKAANRCDSGRVQPRILFLVVPLRVQQFIPLGRDRGCNWLQETLGLAFRPRD